MKKKYVGVILMLALAGAALVGCSFNKKDQTPPAPESSPVSNQESQSVEENKSEEPKQNENPSENKGKPDGKKNKVDSKPKTKTEPKKDGSKKNNNEDYKKISGKFGIELPNNSNEKLSEKEKAFVDALKKELEKMIYEFNENGTFVVSGAKGKFEQTKDKVILSGINGNNAKKEFNYNYDGNTLKLIDPNSKEEVILKRK